jgi:hypothetical protein
MIVKCLKCEKEIEIYDEFRLCKDCRNNYKSSDKLKQHTQYRIKKDVFKIGKAFIFRGKVNIIKDIRDRYLVTMYIDDEINVRDREKQNIIDIEFFDEIKEMEEKK